MVAIYICPHCGYIDGYPHKSNGKNVCAFCEYEMIKYIPEIDWLKVCALSVDDLNSLSCDFQSYDEYNCIAWEHRDHMQRGRKIKTWPVGFNYKYKEGVVHPECPFCHQYWTTKIGGTSRVLSAGIFGLGSKKIGKQWHCWFCDSDF